MNKENEIVNKVKQRFPEFIIPNEAIGSPTIVFDFLFSYLRQGIFTNHDELIKRFITFIDELSISNDNLVNACIETLFLDIYDDRGVNFDNFIMRLSKISKEKYDATIQAWKRQ